MLLVVIAGALIGCDGQSLEKALAPDPETQRWNSPSPELTSPQPAAKETPQPKVTVTPTLETPQQFVDLESAPSNLRPLIEDLARLELLNPGSQTNAGDPLFEPNQPIDRATFVRWLVQTNNRLYRDRPTRQLRLAEAESAQPVYTDVPPTHPDFPYIQGLAEAGYLPSPLTGDVNEKTFRPAAPLTRETLLNWKVPVDQQKILPTATAAKVKELWGFKDSDQVSTPAASAIVADHANGDLANIRRMVGASLLLQPQKPVTRAEAAAALWYIGTEGQGYSAKEVLRAEVQSASSPTPPAEISPSASP